MNVIAVNSIISALSRLSGNLVLAASEAADTASKSALDKIPPEHHVVLGLSAYILYGFMIAGGVFLFLLVFSDLSDWFGGREI